MALGLGFGCGPRPIAKTKINSEFNSVRFGIEINKLFKMFDTQKCLGLKISDFFQNY